MRSTSLSGGGSGHMVNVKVDYATCSGCGTCQVLCPGVFEVRDDGKAWVVNPEGGGDCDWDEVVNSCPTSSITVEGLKVKKERKAVY